MSDEQNQKAILLGLKEVAQKVDSQHDHLLAIDKKIDLHIQKTEYELGAINALDEHQNTLLDEHIRGVRTLEKMLEAHERKDMDMWVKVTAPQTWWIQTVKLIGQASVIAGFVFLILRVVGKA